MNDHRDKLETTLGSFTVNPNQSMETTYKADTSGSGKNSGETKAKKKMY